MKRVLTVMLAAFLVFSSFPLMTSAAGVLGMSGGASVLDGSQIEDFGNIVLGKNTNTLEIPVIWQGFEGATGPSDITENIMNCMTIKFSDPATDRLFPIRHKKHYTKDGIARFTLTAQNIGTAQGKIWVEYADRYTGEITESEHIPISGSYIDPTINKDIVGFTGLDLAYDRVTVNGKVVTKEALSDLGVLYPGSVIEFRLNTDFFVWEPEITDMGSIVRASTLSNNQVKAYKKTVNGSKPVKEVVIENIDGRAYVILRLVDDWDAVKDQDFEIEISLAQKGKKDDRTMVSVSGSVGYDTIFVKGRNDYAYLGDGGNMVEADGYCENAQLDMGCGLSVYLNLSNGKKCYGIASDKRTDGDLDIMNYYPVIKKAISLKTVNIRETGDVVKLDVDEDYYVYDADGNMIGRTQDKLPLRDKYYLATEEIVFDQSLFGNSETDEGVDDEFISEDNYNPQTGALQEPGLQVTTCLGILLLGIGVVCLAAKKR